MEPHGLLFIAIELPNSRGATRSITRELVASATNLWRTLHPRYPIDVLANQRATRALSVHGDALNWNIRVIARDARLERARREWPTDAVRLAYLHNLIGLMQTRFGRTVELDCDVFVIAPRFALDLLRNALGVADIAMPLDPGRAAHLVPHEAATSKPAPWVAPTLGPPMLCSAVIAYRRNAPTKELFAGAAHRLLTRRHPGVRQGDQEMIWFQYSSGEGNLSSRLRLMALPEEAYCPLESHQRPLMPDWRATAWRTSWRRGVYPCAAVHGHAYARAVRGTTTSR